MDEKTRVVDIDPINSSDESIYHRAKNWQIAMFYLCSGSGMAFYVLMNYVSYIANAGFGIAVALTGVIMTASRILDGVTDPIVALIIDRVNTSHGKVRLFMWLGWGMEAGAVLIMYVFCADKGYGIITFLLAYILYVLGYTFFGVATNICGPVLSNDPKQRPMLARWNTIYSYVFPMVFNIVMTLILLPRFNNEYSVPMLRLTAILVLCISCFLVILSCIGIAEYDRPENFVFKKKEDDEAPKIGFGQMLKCVKENKAFQRYIVACASDKLAAATAGQAIVSTLFFGIMIGNMQLGNIFSIITMLPSIVFLLISTRMAVNRGNMESMLVWTKAAIIVSILSIVFCALTDMTTIMREIIPTAIFFVLQLLFSGFKMGISANSGAMLSDIIDYEMSRSSNFMPGTMAATYSFIDKLISAFSAMVATGCVAIIGYRTIMPQPNDQATPATFTMTMFLYYGLPIIGFVLTLIAMKGYTLTKDKMVEVQTITHKLRKEAKEN